MSPLWPTSNNEIISSTVSTPHICTLSTLRLPRLPSPRPAEFSNYVDEKLPVFVVLEILVQLDDTLFEHYLKRLAVSLEVTAIDARKAQHGHGGRVQETTHLLYQTTINEESNPRIQLEGKHRRLAVWKLDVPLGHPKSPLSNPRVVLTCSATLRPADAQKPQLEDEYIVSRQVPGINLLEPFAGDTDLGHIAPRLSASRVSRVIPVTHAPQQSLRPLGYAAKRGFGIFPAINIRLRYNRVQSGTKTTVVACLDLEVTTYGEYTVTIYNVAVSVAGGMATPLSPPPSETSPMICCPRDDTTILFALAPSDSTSSSTTNMASTSTVRQLSVTLQATAHLSPHCNPEISTHWTTTVDFAPPPNPRFPTHGGIQRAHRPPSLGSIVHGATVSSSSGIRPPTLHPPPISPGVVFTPPMNQGEWSGPGGSSSQAGCSLGLTFTFTGPPRVYVGEVFSWSVFVVNRSNETRKLLLIVPPKRKRTGSGKDLPPTPGGSAVAEAVVDEALVYQAQRNMHLDAAELVALVNNVGIG